MPSSWSLNHHGGPHCTSGATPGRENAPAIVAKSALSAGFDVVEDDARQACRRARARRGSGRGPGACRSSPIASAPASRPTSASSRGERSRSGPRWSCSTPSSLAGAGAPRARRPRAAPRRDRRGRGAASPRTARIAASASAGSRSTSGRRASPWSLARPPSAAKRSSHAVSAASSDSRSVDRGPASRAGRPRRSRRRGSPSSRCAASGRKVGIIAGAPARRAAPMGGEVVDRVVGRRERRDAEAREQRPRRQAPAAGGSPRPRSRAPSPGRARRSIPNTRRSSRCVQR